MEGDRILSIDGYRVLLTSDVTTGLSLGADTSYDIVVQRNGERKNCTMSSWNRQNTTAYSGTAWISR